MLNGLHLLPDNQDISSDTYAKTGVLLNEARRRYLSSRRDIEKRGLDPDVFLPGNIWATLNSPNTFIDWTCDALVSSIPPRYHIVAPPRAGEIGLLHNGRVVNPGVILYQRRVNALYAGGALEPVEEAIAIRRLAGRRTPEHLHPPLNER